MIHRIDSGEISKCFRKAKAIDELRAFIENTYREKAEFPIKTASNVYEVINLRNFY